MDRKPPEPPLPPYIEQSVVAVEKFHLQHPETASHAEMVLDNIRVVGGAFPTVMTETRSK